MRVLIVASTALWVPNIEKTGYIPHSKLHENEAPPVESTGFPGQYGPEFKEWAEMSFPNDIDELHEAAGRGCYLSENRPNPATNTNATYLDHILDVNHESVVGHGHVTFHVRGVSRALLLELERHQQRYSINFSVMSQRYVDHGPESDIEVVVPPLFTKAQAKRLRACFRAAQDEYDRAYHELRDLGFDVKEARGAARAFLLESTETRFYVTGSIRAWRDIVVQRFCKEADAEIREFGRLVLIELEKVAKNSVQDLSRNLLGRGE